MKNMQFYVMIDLSVINLFILQRAVTSVNNRSTGGNQGEIRTQDFRTADIRTSQLLNGPAAFLKMYGAFFPDFWSHIDTSGLPTAVIDYGETTVDTSTSCEDFKGTISIKKYLGFG
jgi:hypothetical protein